MGLDVPGAIASAGELRFPSLFQPIRLGSVEIRNRFVFQPHFTALGGRDGVPSDDHVAYHEERAIGGAGLIVFESQAIHPSGKMSRRFVNAWDPTVVPALARVTGAVHRHGAKIFSQLTHGGHTSLEHPPHLLWAPTQMPEPSSHFSTKALDADDIRAVVEGFAASARNAMDAGFDGIEIKIAHDGLLRSFASPFFNRRTDAYGGSFENRMRLSMEVLEAIRRMIGDGVPLGVRLCVQEFTAFGYDIDYGLDLAEYLQSSGLVTYFNSDAGSFSSYWMEIPPAAVPTADFRRINVALKQASRIPVVAFGRIQPAQLAEDMIANGEADMIGMARQLIADPHTPNKLRVGRADLVRSCISCNDACIFQVGQEKAVRCVHNPGAGQERRINERNLAPLDLPRHVVVVGGGPAGMKVAEVSARRGHRVTLLERSGMLGGQIRLAERQPEHGMVAGVADYLVTMMGELDVDVRTGVEASLDAVAALAPDIVVVATGSHPNLPNMIEDGSALSRELGRQILPDIPGLDRPFVISSDDVLLGRVDPRGKVLVIDGNGHWEAAGTAEFLADKSCQVEILAAGEMVGAEIEGGTRTLFLRRAAIKGIRMRTGCTVLEVGDRRVQVARTFSGADAVGWAKYVLMPGDEEWIEDVDWVVAVIGRRSREDLYLRMKRHPEFSGIRVERVGDCVAPRLIESTIAEAFALGNSL
ncbi:MAG: FAD-dependent oxidoreductase [Rubellimicrobium sp.]|nr:FAD-dependent oxidoreductase [Rubellimicrobium sp.]